MIRHDLSQWVLALVIVAGGSAAVWAQESGRSGFGGGGFPSTEESFRRMDRNGNDTIDPEEWETIPAPIRRAYEDFADLSRPMDYDDFVEVSQKMREQLMSRFGGGRGGSFERRDRSRGDSADDESTSDDRDSGSRRSRGGFGGSDEPSSSNADSAGKKSEKSTSKSAKSRTPINVKLPEQFRSRDKDRDGQIGLYEWPRSDYSGFRKLDRNGDGFLTPQELLRAAPVTTVSSAGTATDAASGKGVEGGGLPPSTPKNPAETAFNLIDKDKDGSLSEVEWGKSILASKKFKDAGIEVSFPLSRSRFYEQYPKAYHSTGN
jgi:Ca2+-binding EF-hand superfamily protein